MLRTGRLLPPSWLSTLRSDAGSLLPGFLATTRTGLPPAGGRKLTDTRDHATSLTSSPADRARPLGTL
jgi:hypothetical protein